MRRQSKGNPGKTIAKVVGKPPGPKTTYYEDPGPQSWIGDRLVPASELTPSGSGYQATCGSCSWHSQTLPLEDAKEALKSHPCSA